MRRVEVLSPFTGRVLPLEAVPDPVFAERMMGDGLAVEPEAGLGVAPITGNLPVFHSAGHAFAVQADDSEVFVLVHVGLDTVYMQGRGFTRLAEVGEAVSAGQALVQFDLGAIAAAGHSPLSPVVLPELPSSYRVEKTAASHVCAGESILFTIEIPE